MIYKNVSLPDILHFSTKVQGALLVSLGQWESLAWPFPPLQTASSWLTGTDGNLCIYNILLVGNKRKLNCSLESVTDGWVHLLLTGTPPERVIEGTCHMKGPRGEELKDGRESSFWHISHCCLPISQWRRKSNTSQKELKQFVNRAWGFPRHLAQKTQHGQNSWVNLEADWALLIHASEASSKTSKRLILTKAW